MKKEFLNLQKTGLLTLFFLFSAGVCLAQDSSEQIKNLLDKYHEYDQFNGSVLVAHDGKVIFSDGFGMANMEHDIPNRPDTKFRIGSITKQFTAALILQLVEEEKLELDKPISTYLPEYTGPAAGVVNIHHLLTHSSGIPSYTSFPNFFAEHSRDPYYPADMVKTFADSTLQFNPGERFEYNNSAYFLLGHLIEEIEGKSYEEVLQERIFDPLNLEDTGYDHQATIMRNRASGYERAGRGFMNAPYLDMSIPYAAGSLYSTAEDLYKWDRALNGNEILSQESKDLMFSPHMDMGNAHYGYGWMINKVATGKSGDSVQVIGHGGGINGFNTLIARIPEEDKLIILLNNTGRQNLEAITVSIHNLMHGEEAEMPKRSIAREILPVFETAGSDAGMKKYKELEADKTYGLDEGDMNQTGYALLQNGKVKEAIEVFRINTEAFPDSWNTYDSLGEAYMLDRQKQKAIENYEKSIEMNPDNNNGKEMLAKIRSL